MIEQITVRGILVIFKIEDEENWDDNNPIFISPYLFSNTSKSNISISTYCTSLKIERF